MILAVLAGQRKIHIVTKALNAQLLLQTLFVLFKYTNSGIQNRAACNLHYPNISFKIWLLHTLHSPSEKISDEVVNHLVV